MRSDLIKSGFDKAPHRSLLKATGVIKSDEDFKKPFIGICNSYIDLIPGHVHLQEFGKIRGFDPGGLNYLVAQTDGGLLDGRRQHRQVGF